jgi:hypothetical protein
MDLLDFLLWFMKASNWLALIVAGAIGYLAGSSVPAGWWSIFTSMLLSYHLFLCWLVFSSKGKMGTVRSLSYAAMIHVACLVVIAAIGSGRIFVPHFDVVCCGVAVLAFFERDWLFQSSIDATAADE